MRTQVAHGGIERADLLRCVASQALGRRQRRVERSELALPLRLVQRAVGQHGHAHHGVVNGCVFLAEQAGAFLLRMAASGFSPRPAR
ncbi:hypothetical protein SR858_18730 [Duganella zoogloeoides]|uniref:Uncharacterized protein n=1 Tax=Duganella zoogloeoides TaxID=75659 RepID=A0ABZ0XTM2_9BURK|nr:hypothetical protein [Duganella zoogloeoides]WQH03085.1 hypothetical protein SR858_18730 [Duganella zoogloeoides]